MSTQRAAAIVLRQLYLYRGSPARILPLFGCVAIDIILWGFITRYLNTVTTTGISFVPTLLGAVLFWDFFIRVMQSVTTTFLEDVWSRNFLNLFATPLAISEYLSGLIMASIGSSLLGLIVMLILASAFFSLSFFSYGILLIPFLLVLFMFGIALGIFAAGLVLRMGPAAEWLIWPIPAMLSPLACVFYPRATLPDWMRPMTYLLPPSYVFEGMRAAISHAPMPASALPLGLGLAFVSLAAACWYFTRVFHHVVRNGLIARYSAETLT